MKPASSMRSTAIRCPSGPTTAIEIGTPMSSAFSTTALMNSRHSTARNLAMLFILSVNHPSQLRNRTSFAQSSFADDLIPFFRFACDGGGKFIGRTTFDVEPGAAQRLRDILVLERLVDRARELVDDRARRSRRRHHTEPQAGVKTGQARFGDRRQLRRRR